MNFFKKVLGFGGDNLKNQAESTKIEGTLYRVIKDIRNIMYHEPESRFPKCAITFEFNESEYLIVFNNNESSASENSSYAFPIHTEMNLVSFNMNKGDKVHGCFEWCLDDTRDHVGCYMDPKETEKFREVLCKTIKHLLNDENIKDHLKLCKELPAIPIYKSSEDSEIKSSYEASSKISSKSETELELNEILIREAGKEENRMVHSAAYYEIVDKERKLVNGSVVFALKEVGKFEFELQLINAAGFTFLRKELTPGLIYEINTDLGYIKWMQIKEGYKVVEVNFEGKRDAAMSLKFAVLQCLYEFNTKRRLHDAIAEDEITYFNRISEQINPNDNAKIVKTYEDAKEEIEFEEPKFVYGNSEAEKGIEKYRAFCQAKINSFDVAALGNMIETLKISEDNKVVRLGMRKVADSKGEPLHVDNIVLYDSDEKAVLNDSEGQLHFYDMEKGSVIQSYVHLKLKEDLSQKGIQDICPEFKLAEANQYKTLKAVSPNTIYEIDPRLKDGSQNMKSYQTSPEFNRIAVDKNGRFAVSSANGEIRLFDKIGKNANCKYPGLGDPVLHLESTKDGRWLLATYQSYLLLLPTETEDEVSLYENKIRINERPRPIKLKIKLEHLQLCKVSDLNLLPAKFDERKGEKEMFIVSGFGEYVVIWNLAQVIRGDIDNYKFAKIDGELVQTDFMFNNVKKLIMTTNTGIVIKENKIKQ